MLNPLDNPYYLAGGVVARMAANTATALWAAVILLKHDTLTTAGASYSWIVQHVNEDFVAIGFGSLAIAQTIWLCLHWAPIKLWGRHVCSLGYGAMALGWLFVLGNVLFGNRPIQPTSVACVTVIVLLSLFAFVSNARDEGDGGGN